MGTVRSAAMMPSPALRAPPPRRWWHGGLRIMLLVTMLTLLGCAGGPSQYAGIVDDPGDLPTAVELTDVPFYPQDAYQCGPAALATVMTHLGIDTDPEALAPGVYLPDRQGSLQPELLGAVRRAGLVGYVHDAELSDVLREVAAGNPVLVMQNLGLDRFPVWHYAVVVGFDLDARRVVLRSGTVEREVMSMRAFERSWRLADHWALSLHTPGAMPATAQPDAALEAVAALEDVQQLDAARLGYLAIVSQWPENTLGWLGLGNARYRMERYAEAERAYRAAVRSDAGSAAAHHNLAWALIRQDRGDEAIEPAAHAARLASADQAHYRSALDHLAPSDATDN